MWFMVIKLHCFVTKCLFTREEDAIQLFSTCGFFSHSSRGLLFNRDSYFLDLNVLKNFL